VVDRLAKKVPQVLDTGGAVDKIKADSDEQAESHCGLQLHHSGYHSGFLLTASSLFRPRRLASCERRGF
jgi:hypothetical protein